MDDIWTLRKKAERTALKLSAEIDAFQFRVDTIEDDIADLERERDEVLDEIESLRNELAELDVIIYPGIDDDYDDDDPPMTEQELADFERTIKRLTIGGVWPDGSLSGFEWWNVPLYPELRRH